ncbi:MAG TPA: hypothetical protein VG167_04365 [Verrucomicrobiae bacterium]|nr:hypothetical protein [Verrucomicrobiae bacterium]
MSECTNKDRARILIRSNIQIAPLPRFAPLPRNSNLQRNKIRAPLSCSHSQTTEVFSRVQDSFTPCKVSQSLLEAVAEAARDAALGDVVLLSPACSSLDQFRDDQHRGEVLNQAAESIARGAQGRYPYMHGEIERTQLARRFSGKLYEFASGFSAGKTPRQNQHSKVTLTIKNKPQLIPLISQ